MGNAEYMGVHCNTQYCSQCICVFSPLYSCLVLASHPPWTTSLSTPTPSLSVASLLEDVLPLSSTQLFLKRFLAWEASLAVLTSQLMSTMTRTYSLRLSILQRRELLILLKIF